MNINLCIIAITIGFISCSQNEIKPPNKISDNFFKQFPEATSIKWEKESEEEWEAEFKINNINYSSNFDRKGNIIEIEHEIELNEVPSNVIKKLNESYIGYKIKEIEISKTNKGFVYEFEIESSENNMEIAINTLGIITKEEIN